MKIKSNMILALVLTIICAFPIYSHAESEEFTLRNGIAFGMSEKEVDKLETLSRDKTYPLINYYGYGKITNINYSGVQYHFTNGKLKEVEINFDALSKRGISYNIKDYADISGMLTAKYGKPLGFVNGQSHYLRGTEFDTYMSSYSLWALLGVSLDYEEWLVPVNGGYVKIDHHFNYGKLKGKDDYHHFLEYTFFSTDEVKNLFNGI